MNNSISKLNRKKSNSKICGWNDLVKPYRESAITWHKIWKQCGSPEYGQIADIRRNSRKQYHDKLKQTKNNQDQIKKTKLANALITKNYNDFWKGISNERGCKTQLPNNVDGKCKGEICDIFYEKYKSLYQTESVDKMKSLAVDLNNNLMNKCKSLSSSCRHLHSIDSSQVGASVKRLKSGNVETTSELYTDSIKMVQIYFSYIYLFFLVLCYHTV